MDGQTVTILGSLLAGAGAVLGSLGTWLANRRARRLDAINLQRTQRVDAIGERDALIRSMTEGLLGPIQRELAELRDWKTEAERRISELEDRGDRLVAFIYKLLGIMRNHGVDHEIAPADVPPGIHI